MSELHFSVHKSPPNNLKVGLILRSPNNVISITLFLLLWRNGVVRLELGRGSPTLK